ncbi:MAG: hypothetical protein AAFO59_06770, partial [Cyanobacteria bacterium J06607_17]
MTFVLLSILLGILTYWVIGRGVATMTRSPVWLLWLIIMTPILALTAWVLRYGRYTPPNLLILGLFIICPLIYTWVVLLGILTYWVIGRGVATMTRSPVWLLWLIIMTPILALTAWVLRYGRYTPPNLLILGLFIICPLIYTWVVLLGRRPPAEVAAAAPRPRPVPPMLMAR